MDTPKSVVPGSEYGELLVVGGLALNELTSSVRCLWNGVGGLSEALAAITPLLTLHNFERDNASLRENFLAELPSHVSVFVVQKFIMY